uniref:Uncharacterized protein n=1 Tax=Ditylenchus dipsaci TaxID=166011 RepID=A0A915D6M6_9BILA
MYFRIRPLFAVCEMVCEKTSMLRLLMLACFGVLLLASSCKGSDDDGGGADFTDFATDNPASFQTSEPEDIFAEKVADLPKELQEFVDLNGETITVKLPKSHGERIVLPLLAAKNNLSFTVFQEETCLEKEQQWQFNYPAEDCDSTMGIKWEKEPRSGMKSFVLELLGNSFQILGTNFMGVGVNGEDVRLCESGKCDITLKFKAADYKFPTTTTTTTTSTTTTTTAEPTTNESVLSTAVGAAGVSVTDASGSSNIERSTEASTGSNNLGLIIGCAVGGVVLLSIVIGVLLWYCVCRPRRRRLNPADGSAPDAGAAGVSAAPSAVRSIPSVKPSVSSALPSVPPSTSSAGVEPARTNIGASSVPAKVASPATPVAGNKVVPALPPMVVVPICSAEKTATNENDSKMTGSKDADAKKETVPKEFKPKSSDEPVKDVPTNTPKVKEKVMPKPKPKDNGGKKSPYEALNELSNSLNSKIKTKSKSTETEYENYKPSGDLLDLVQAREIQGTLQAEADQAQPVNRHEEAVNLAVPLVNAPFFSVRDVHVEFLRPKSCRGRDVLVYDGGIFRFWYDVQHNTGNIQSKLQVYKCVAYPTGCMKEVHLSNQAYFRESTIDHDHDVDPVEVDILRLTSRTFDLLKQNPLRQNNSLYTEATLGFLEVVVDGIDKASLFRQLSSRRQGSCDTMFGNFMRLRTRLYSLILDLEKDETIGMSSRYNLEQMASSEVWAVDGTFRSCPAGGWKQIWSIHYQVKRDFICGASFYMTDQDSPAYISAFDATKKSVQDAVRNGVFRLKLVLSDFEAAIRLAVMEVFPGEFLFSTALFFIVLLPFRSHSSMLLLPLGASNDTKNSKNWAIFSVQERHEISGVDDKVSSDSTFLNYFNT